MAMQIDLFLPDGGIRPRSLGDCEPVPPGPYHVTMLWDIGLSRYVPPYAVCAHDGQVIAGLIDNLGAAKLIAERLNGAAAP